jgi:hypothetical protein
MTQHGKIGMRIGLALMLCVLALQAASPAYAGDPAGTQTGTIKDVPAKEVGNPTLQ